MRCAVIGGSGFIGRPLVARLAAAGHKVTSIDMRAPSSVVDDVDYHIGSFADPAFLRDVMAGHAVCFHLAATTTPATSDRDMGFDLQSNVAATLTLLDACVEAKLAKFIFLSSGGTVYGPPDVTPTPEDHPLRPICAYGVSKVSIENYLRVYKRTRGLDYKIVRLSNPFGPGQPISGGQGAISIFMGRAINNELIQIWGDGNVVRDFLYIDDVINGIEIVAFSGLARDTYNLGSGIGVSINEILENIKFFLGRPLHLQYTGARAFDVAANILDCTAIKRDSAWVQSIDIKEGMRRTFTHLQNE